MRAKTWQGTGEKEICMDTQQMIDKALEYAATAHEGQKRKGGNMPFIVHPVGVAMLLQAAGAPQTAVIAGLLHETAGDAETAVDGIRDVFGPKVAEIVAGCREDCGERKGTPERRSQTWRERKEHSLESLQKTSVEVKRVACADALDNVRTIARALRDRGEEVWDRFRNTDRSEQAGYYRGMVDSLRPLGRGALDAVHRKLWIDLEWEVGELFGYEHGRRLRGTRQDVQNMLGELGKIGRARHRKVLLYLSAGYNVKPEYFGLPYDRVVLSDYTYEQFGVREGKVVLMPYDNNRTIQYLVAEGIEVSCVVAINDGCCEGGNWECVNTVEFFRKLRPALADECLYVRDHYDHSPCRGDESAGKEAMFGLCKAEQMDTPDFVKYAFPDAAGVETFKLRLDERCPRNRRRQGISRE